MAWVRAACVAALFLFGAGTAAWSQDVTLFSRDKSVEISGTLLGFDGEFYRLDTIYGELTVDGSGVSCDGPGCPNLDDYVAEIDISGARSMGRVLLPALFEVFAQNAGLSLLRFKPEPDEMEFVFSDAESGKPVGRFYLHLTGTEEGFADLLADEADLVLARREVTQIEVDRASEIGLGNLRDRSRVLALDALVPIVSPGNPITQISSEMLSQVLSGKINDWSQLGGPEAPISIHLRDRTSGLFQRIDQRLLAPVNQTLSETARRYLTDQDVAKAVEADPFGIGIASANEIGNTKTLALSGSCGFELKATRRTIKTEDYPLTAPLFLYSPARRLPKLARDFLTFSHSPAAQLVVRRAGFTDQTVETIPVEDQGSRFVNAIAQAGPEIELSELRRMIDVMKDKSRLTLSFRFEAGSSSLDGQSRSNVAYLAQLLEAGIYDTRELVFMGFSDGEGSATANRTISERRAQAVLEAVRSAAETANFDRLSLKAEAFGEALPMACDDSAWGRQVNRRVEVWVK